MNKGFTLIELLGVIILLSLLALIIIPTITSSIREGEETADKQVQDNIVLAARSWAVDNKDKLPTKVCLSTLQNGGYIDKDITMPSTGKAVTNACVNITASGKSYKYTYSTSCSGCI